MPNDLKAGISSAHTSPQVFQLLYKGTEVELYVGKIDNTEVDQAKLRMKTPKVVKGKCSIDKETCTFVSGDAPPAHSLMEGISKYIKEKAHVTIAKDKIEFKKPSDDGQKGVSPEGSNAPSQEELAYNKKLSELDGDIKEAISKGGASAQIVTVTKNEALNLANNKKFPEAIKKLEQLEERLKGGSSKDAPPKVNPEEELYKSELLKLEGEIDNAIKAGGTSAQIVKVTKAEALNLGNNGKFKEAIKKLVEAALLSKGDSGKGSTHTVDPKEAEFKTRILKLQDSIKEVVSGGGAAAGTIKHLEAEALHAASDHKFDKANAKLDEIDQVIKDSRDAHGNVRALVEKEDSMVKDAIKKVPEKAVTFTNEKFGGRMKSILGDMEGVTWDSMVGAKSNPFDVISQRDLFKEDMVDKKHKLNYLDFQNAMYPDEAESRGKMVKAFYDKKLAAMKEKKENTDKLEKAFREFENNPKDPTTINNAYDAMGMKGLRPKVLERRKEIKDRLFLGKTDLLIDRGRVTRTEADVVVGFAAKALKALLDKKDKDNAQKLTHLLEQVKSKAKEVATAQQKLTGYLKVPGMKKEGEKEPPPPPEELTEGLKKVTGELTLLSREAADMMEKLDIGLKFDADVAKRIVEDFQTGGGLGSDNEGGREVYTAGSEVTMGKNMNMRDDSTAASNIFRELGIPYTGGASGSTVDAVGGIVDALLGKDEDPEAELKETDERLGNAEAEICMYIMGMHSAGHHSLCEMIYAAKQYPQKFFRNLHDPITDYIEYQAKVKDFLQKHPSTKALEDDEKKVAPLAPEVRKDLAAKRHEDMVKACPEKIISHDACTKAFMSHAESVLKKVKA